MPAYHDAFKKEFFTLRKPRTEHVSAVRLRGDLNTNIMERLHGTRRDREKVVRRLKKEESPFVNGQDIFYNFIRKHMGLKGLTPAQASNVGFGLGRNKWLGLIKKALSHKN
ncbi:MAG: hypothetical protein RMJ07_02360 [Nitrososphaerota archaeon]|nr:hypothetical protein [Candidatus Bathyarchaeota archaeon]MDW8048512.1 hypothetical protein [Nitrososphaerota archaeon]